MQTDIIRMAREAGLPMAWISDSGVLRWSDLERFAALVAAAERDKYEAKFKQLEAIMQEREQQPNKPCCLAEREKCAQLVETYEKAGNTMNAPEYVMVFKDCAAAIRARKNKQ